jgi:hypothetical protein
MMWFKSLFFNHTEIIRDKFLVFLLLESYECRGRDLNLRFKSLSYRIVLMIIVLPSGLYVYSIMPPTNLTYLFNLIIFLIMIQVHFGKGTTIYW